MPGDKNNQPDQLTITQAQKEDLETILQLQKKCFQEEAQLYNDALIPPLLQDLNSLHQEYITSLVLKASIDHQIVGSVRAYELNETCYISKLIVDSEFQNKGIGKKLMEKAERSFPKCERFELFTGDKSLKNLSLYYKIGYREFRRKHIRNNLTLVYLEKFVMI